MDRTEKKLLRADLFRHLDGIVTGPTAYALHQKGVLEFLLKEKQCDLEALADSFKANEGYLNVALRVIAGQGWIDYKVENDKVKVAVNSKSAVAFELVPLYKEVVELMKLSGKYHRRKFELEPFLFLEKIFNNFKSNYGITFSEEKETLKVHILKELLLDLRWFR